MSKPQVLQLSPPTELVFDGPFTEVVTCNLSLTNPTNEIVYFKVKTTAPRYYCVRPNSGVIQPSGTAKITVMLQPVDQPSSLDKERTKHKFMIQSAFSKDDDLSVDDFWKTVDPSKIMDSKLKVVFNNLNVNGSGSDVNAGTQSADSSIYHDGMAQAQQQPIQRRTAQPTGHENRRSSPTEHDNVGQKERTRLEEENRSLTMQVQELRHKLNAFANNMTHSEGLPMVQVILLALAALLVGIIIGKLF